MKIAKCLAIASMTLGLAWTVGGALADEAYPAPKPLKPAAQAPIKGFSGSKGAKIAYMPPATEFNYYIAIGEGIKDEAAKRGITTFMLAPQSGADINGQMGMIQDVINQKVAAIILSTHDEHAAAPLIKQAVARASRSSSSIPTSPDFPAPVHAVVGYSQRNGTHKEGEYALKLVGDKADAGRHSRGPTGLSLDRARRRISRRDQRIEAQGRLQRRRQMERRRRQRRRHGHAAGASGHQDDLRRQRLRDHGRCAGGKGARTARISCCSATTATPAPGSSRSPPATVTATVDTTPFVMGQIALEVTADVLDNKYPGGWVETPTRIVDKNNVLDVLRHPETLYPKPSKTILIRTGKRPRRTSRRLSPTRRSDHGVAR